MEHQIIEFLKNNIKYTKSLMNNIGLKTEKNIEILNRKESLKKHKVDSVTIESGNYCYVINLLIEEENLNAQKKD